MRQANSDTYSPLLGVLVHQTTCTVKRLGWGAWKGVDEMLVARDGSI
jgi:hypothetical protein